MNQNIFRTPEYIRLDPVTLELEALRLGAHRTYEPIPETAGGLRWSEVLELHLGIADGVLRDFDTAGELIPTAPESALGEHARAEAERKRAEAEHAERLAARLRKLGIDP